MIGLVNRTAVYWRSTFSRCSNLRETKLATNPSPKKINRAKKHLTQTLTFYFSCDSKRPHSECRLMYTDADTCCQQPHAISVTCDYHQHPPVICNPAGELKKKERWWKRQAGNSVRATEDAGQTTDTLTGVLKVSNRVDKPGVFIVCYSQVTHWSHRV